MVKYDSLGSLIWTAQTGTSDNDYGVGITVGEDGSVYVTGYTYGNLNGQPSAGIGASNEYLVASFRLHGYIGTWDIVLLKYDSSGSLIWTRQTGTSSTDVGWGTTMQTEVCIFQDILMRV